MVLPLGSFGLGQGTAGVVSRLFPYREVFMYLAIVVADVGDGDFTPDVTVHGTSAEANHYLAKLVVGYLADADAFKKSVDVKLRAELPLLYVRGDYSGVVDLFHLGNKAGAVMSVRGVSVSPVSIPYTEVEVEEFVREGSELSCSECGNCFRLNDDGTTNHILALGDVPDNGDEVDYDEDEDHVAHDSDE